MAVKLKIPKGNPGGKRGKGLFSRDPVIRAALTVFLVAAVLLVGWFSYYYVKYDRIIDQKFKGQVFSNSAKIYAIPHAVRAGEKLEAKDIATQLRRAGYTDKDGQSPMGSYRLLEHGIEIKPGPDSYHSPEPAKIHFQDGAVDKITGSAGDLDGYELEPQLVTALFDAEQRSKRHLV